jgi:hypothetical protein
MSYRPGRIKREFAIGLERSRSLEDPEVALKAKEILCELRSEIDKAVLAEYTHA